MALDTACCYAEYPFLLNVIYAECYKQAHYANCHYAECHYANCRSADFVLRFENEVYRH